MAVGAPVRNLTQIKGGDWGSLLVVIFPFNTLEACTNWGCDVITSTS